MGRKKPKPKVVRFRFNLVGRSGFEPLKTKSTDLQSVAFGRSAIFPYKKNLELVVGIEPTTV